jgi:hypothetical protein
VLDLTVSQLSNATKRITPSQSQKTVIITLTYEGDYMNFFSRQIEHGANPWIDFSCHFKIMNTGFIWCNNPRKQIFPSASKHASNSE